MQASNWWKDSTYYENPGGGPGGGPGHGGGSDITGNMGTADITGNATGDAGLSGGTGVGVNRIITSDAAPGEDAGEEGDDIDASGASGSSADQDDVGRTTADIVDVGDPIATLGGGLTDDGIDVGGSDALDGRTAGLTNTGGPGGGPVISDEAGPDGGINQVATSESGVTSTNKTDPASGEAGNEALLIGADGNDAGEPGGDATRATGTSTGGAGGGGTG